METLGGLLLAIFLLGAVAAVGVLAVAIFQAFGRGAIDSARNRGNRGAFGILEPAVLVCAGLAIFIGFFGELVLLPFFGEPAVSNIRIGAWVSFGVLVATEAALRSVADAASKKAYEAGVRDGREGDSTKTF